MSGTKISQLSTLTNPPASPVYAAVITNDGTTATNFQAPQGVIVQPNATGTNDGLGILLTSGSPGPDGGGPGQVSIYVGSVTQPGTDSPAHGSLLVNNAGNVSLTNTAGAASAGQAILTGGNVYSAGPNAFGAVGNVGGGYVYRTDTARGGSGEFYGGGASGAVTNLGGNFSVRGGDADQQGGNVILAPGSGATNGVVLLNNIGTVDPHNLGAVFQAATANLLGYYPLYRSRG